MLAETSLLGSFHYNPGGKRSHPKRCGNGIVAGQIFHFVDERADSGTRFLVMQSSRQGCSTVLALIRSEENLYVFPMCKCVLSAAPEAPSAQPKKSKNCDNNNN